MAVSSARLGVLMALGAAGLFGASTPLAKLLLGGGIDPWLLAGLLYLGSGIGLGLSYLARLGLGYPAREAPLRRPDLPWLALVVLSGGVTGPVLLMLGLARMPASSASLLLNVEGLATMAIAWLVFRENVDRRLLLGAAAILAGAALLSWDRGGGAAGGSLGLGALFVIGACVAWGIDNNLTRKLSSADPLQIAAIKGLAAGLVNLALALSQAVPWPGLAALLGAGVIGFLGYGVSLVLFVLALRHLGTARSGAYFSAAPFFGTVLALILFHEHVTLPLVLAAALMAFGLYLHLAERHDHHHVHEALSHEHRHAHDEHHQHEHAPPLAPNEAHTHRHEHRPMRHGHAHYPDLHHREHGGHSH